MPNLHPLVVHFPIALVIVVLIIDLVGLIWAKLSWRQMVTPLVAFFLLPTAALAVITGLLAEESVWHSDAAHELIERHELLGLVFLGLIVFYSAWRIAFRHRPARIVDWIGFLLLIVATLVMVFGAYLGGEMVYRHGTGVMAAKEAVARADSLAAAHPQEMLPKPSLPGEHQHSESHDDPHRNHMAPDDKRK